MYFVAVCTLLVKQVHITVYVHYLINKEHNYSIVKLDMAKPGLSNL